jgi:hypothetical protein
MRARARARPDFWNCRYHWPLARTHARTSPSCALRGRGSGSLLSTTFRLPCGLPVCRGNLMTGSSCHVFSLPPKTNHRYILICTQPLFSTRIGLYRKRISIFESTSRDKRHDHVWNAIGEYTALCAGLS